MVRSKGLQLIIAGAPASGKGTQCETLRDIYGVVHLSTGDMLREAGKDPDSEIGKTAKEYMESGRLVPDSVMIGVVVERLGKPDCAEKGWLLDGFPRTRAQADALGAAGYHPDQFIFLDVADKLLVARVVGRRTDPETGKIYHLQFSPPPEGPIAARLQQRADDTEAKVKVRLQAFHENLAPILAAYKQHTLRVGVDKNEADSSVQKNAIFNRIKSRLDRLSRYTVVFVLGGPGSGKGTQCAKIVDAFGYTHLSAGDLLREEQSSGSEVGDMIKNYIKEGKIVPVEVTIRLLKAAMERSGARDFLIDGFPRSPDNLEGWFKVMGDQAEVAFVLFFDCPEEVMAERLLVRGATSGRADDNEATIRKRFITFKESSVPVVAALARLGKVRTISAAPAPEVVFARVSRLFRGIALLPPTERTLAIIKPDAVAAGHSDAVVTRLQGEGFVIIDSVTAQLSGDRVDAFYAEHTGQPFYPKLKEFMTSGPCTALVLEKVDAIKGWRALLGPTDSNKAKAAAPSSLRAQYGTDGTRNAAHGSDSTASAIREIGFWFPEAPARSRTLAMLKPGTAETAREEALCCIAARGFDIVKTASQVMPRAMAAEFYAEHAGKPFCEGLLNYMTSGEVLAMQLEREAAVPAWRALLGPTDSDKARATAPDSLRALYGKDGRANAAHGSDGAHSAARECMFWFPDRWAAPQSTGAGATDKAAVTANGTGKHSGGISAAGSAEEGIANYMKSKVDVVLAPLLQRLILAQPDNVADFVVKDLQQQQQQHSK